MPQETGVAEDHLLRTFTHKGRQAGIICQISPSVHSIPWGDPAGRMECVPGGITVPSPHHGCSGLLHASAEIDHRAEFNITLRHQTSAYDLTTVFHQDGKLRWK
ncbi:hypothetical protein HPP92_003046 [Vanilla planifolia]|uniref:Uncharacterized protein n=1 Tax=Vanilla planifolia TaxID=51239 RepID=A0A835VIK5_VANPL|nr:hypothetical protein HPP92_003046 [Vanilla planifolia]